MSAITSLLLLQATHRVTHPDPRQRHVGFARTPLPSLSCREARPNACSTHTLASQGSHLVLHEGNERRDHNGKAGKQDAWQLIAQALATCKHDMLSERLLVCMCVCACAAD